MRDYLTKYEISLDTIEKVLTILIKDNWLDDAKYAHSFIHFNLLSGDKGAYALKQKLMQKGIAASIIDDELHQHDFTNLAETVAQKLLKKYQGKLPEKALHDKILQQLINKGFSYEEAKIAYQSLTIENDDEKQQELLYKELDKQYRKYSQKYDGYDLKQRLTQALARKGYDFSDIASGLKEYL